MKILVASVTLAFVMEGEDIQRRVEQLNFQRTKVSIFYDKSIEAFLADPSDENRANMDNMRECLDDIDEEIKTLVAEL